MKQVTKLKNQLKNCKKWAKFARKDWNNKVKKNEVNSFDYLLVAIEQLISYLEMQNETN